MNVDVVHLDCCHRIYGSQIVKASAKSKEKDVPSAELIVVRFQQMRAEQKAIVHKIAEVEADIGRNIGVCVCLSLSRPCSLYM